MVERAAVNRDVVGSSPTSGANFVSNPNLFYHSPKSLEIGHAKREMLTENHLVRICVVKFPFSHGADSFWGRAFWEFLPLAQGRASLRPIGLPARSPPFKKHSSRSLAPKNHCNGVRRL